jgi:hypothetical protein
MELMAVVAFIIAFFPFLFVTLPAPFQFAVSAFNIIATSFFESFDGAFGTFLDLARITFLLNQRIHGEEVSKF